MFCKPSILELSQVHWHRTRSQTGLDNLRAKYYTSPHDAGSDTLKDGTLHVQISVVASMQPNRSAEIGGRFQYLPFATRAGSGCSPGAGDGLGRYSGLGVRHGLSLKKMRDEE
jgi:hypothetical protein